MNRLKTLAVATALVGAVALPAAAQAATLVVPLTGIQTFGTFQSGLNTVQTFNIGAGAHITSVSYNVSITTIAAGSWLSEASIYYTDSPVTAGVVTRPGFGSDNSGSGTFTGTADLVALGLDFVVGANGLLRLEYVDSYDDAPGADAQFTAGTITFTYEPAATAVPEPATWGMMILGFGMIGAAARRRAVKTTVSFA